MDDKQNRSFWVSLERIYSETKQILLPSQIFFLKRYLSCKFTNFQAFLFVLIYPIGFC